MASKIVFGHYKPKDRPNQFLMNAYWTDEANVRIDEALADSNVKFHIETQNIPDGEAVYVTLKDDDRRINLSEDQENDTIGLKVGDRDFTFSRVQNNKVEFTISLINLREFMANEEDGVLELYFACSYKWEHLDLPKKTSEYLKVKGMPKMIFVNGQWNIAASVPFGENFGPTESGKPYWVNNFASSFRAYLQNSYQINEKYILNGNRFNNELLEQKGLILYYDGGSSYGGDQSGSDRFNNGRTFAEEHYEDIKIGIGKESFYLVSHSEGGAYAAGIADYLYEKGHTIGEHVLLSPDEGNEFSINPIIPSYQLHYMFFSSIYNPLMTQIKLSKFKRWGNYYAIVDWVTNEHKIPGITKMGIVHYQETGWTGVHGWTNGNNSLKKVQDLKTVVTFDVQGEHNGEFYAGKDQTKTKNGTRFYRIDNDYIITNCPPLIEP
ncbi:MAG: hypothetical protein ACTIJ9_11310 [Aequorivita sp.]